MVSFTCNHCQDVVKKPKVQSHANTCGSYSFTCVDCMHVFDLDTIKAHTSCVTEEDKYQGKWKQKLSNDGGAGSGPAAVPRGIERPPRAPMDDLSSSEESDADWVTTTRTSAKKEREPAKTTATTRRKNPRPGVSPSSDDDEEDDQENSTNNAHRPNPKRHSSAALPMVPPAKRAKTTKSASATPPSKPLPTPAALRSPRDASLGPQPMKNSAAAATTAAEVELAVASHPGKKDTPLLLPRSTTSTECVVPSFVLGTSAEMAEIVRDVLAEKGVTSLRGKELALALVDRYAKRIAKSVRHAVDTAVELGSLKLDENGKVAMA